jgi:hypothetical protein
LGKQDEECNTHKVLQNLPDEKYIKFSRLFDGLIFEKVALFEDVKSRTNFHEHNFDNKARKLI